MNEREAPRVLVADADENVLHLLEIKLVRAGFAVDRARDAATTRARAWSAPPDLVLLGEPLPGTGDGDLVAELAAGDGGRRLAVVLLSARAGVEDVQRALASGAQDYVLKPFSPQDLVHRLNVALLRSRLARGADR